MPVLTLAAISPLPITTFLKLNNEVPAALNKDLLTFLLSSFKVEVLAFCFAFHCELLWHVSETCQLSSSRCQQPGNAHAAN